MAQALLEHRIVVYPVRSMMDGRSSLRPKKERIAKCRPVMAHGERGIVRVQKYAELGLPSCYRQLFPRFLSW
jgi:hypothetical protein